MKISIEAPKQLNLLYENEYLENSQNIITNV